jgi:hypothetical protein
VDRRNFHFGALMPFREGATIPLAWGRSRRSLAATLFFSSKPPNGDGVKVSINDALSRLPFAQHKVLRLSRAQEAQKKLSSYL